MARRGRMALDVDASDVVRIVLQFCKENNLTQSYAALADEVAKGTKVGVDVTTGEPFDPAVAGVYDNFIVKAQILHSAPVIATQLLLVDEVMRAGVNMR